MDKEIEKEHLSFYKEHNLSTIAPPKKKKFIWFKTQARDIAIGSSLIVGAVIMFSVSGMLLSSVFNIFEHHRINPMLRENIVVSNNTIEQTNFIKDIYIKDTKTVVKDIEALKKANLLNTTMVVNSSGEREFITPLIFAAKNNSTIAIKPLIESGANINDETKTGINALNLVSPNEKNQINPNAQYLIEKGIDWKNNDFAFLKDNIKNPAWRSYWIDYLAKHNPELLPMYENMIRSSYVGDLSIINNVDNKIDHK